VEEVLDEEEHSEQESEESVGATQAEVQNSVLRAFIDISYHEQQGFGEE
jgi:hypothetical protein